MTDPACAVWYWQHGCPDVELFADEGDAMRWAFHRSEYGTASIEGVQYADGSYVDLNDWSAFTQYERAQGAAAASNATVAQPVPMRLVHGPYEPSEIVEVPADSPTWLGRQ